MLIFDLSTSMPLLDTRCPSTIPSITMKWHFSKLSTRFVFMHLVNTLDRFSRHASNDSTYTVKSSIKTFMQSYSKSEKILVIQRWNVLDTLHRPNSICVYAKVPNRQVKVVLLVELDSTPVLLLESGLAFFFTLKLDSDGTRFWTLSSELGTTSACFWPSLSELLSALGYILKSDSAFIRSWPLLAESYSVVNIFATYADNGLLVSATWTSALFEHSDPKQSNTLVSPSKFEISSLSVCCSTSSSIRSMPKRKWSLVGCFIASKMLNYTRLSPNFIESVPACTSIFVLVVIKNGHPRIKIDVRMTLIEAPKSNMASTKVQSPMVHGIEKILGSQHFYVGIRLKVDYDAYQLVSTYEKCQNVGMAISRRHEMPQQPILFCEVFDVWGIDFMGPFLVSNGYSYILLAVDYVSRWVEAIATKTNDAKVVVDFLKSNIFYWFGVPKALISDQESHFCNKPMSSLLHKYGVRRLLEDTLWAHRTAYRTPLGMSPYRIVFGKACTQSLLSCQTRKFQLQELDELCLEAYENSRIYKQKVKKFHDQQTLRKEFRVGQKVLLFNSRLNLIAGKLRSRWDGSFVIINVFPYGAVELKYEHANSTFQVNGHKIKLFHEGPVPPTGDMETISLKEPTPPDDTP
ncbi:gag-pol, partial [Mucuna pruriens]